MTKTLLPLCRILAWFVLAYFILSWVVISSRSLSAFLAGGWVGTFNYLRENARAFEPRDPSAWEVFERYCLLALLTAAAGLSVRLTRPRRRGSSAKGEEN
jgi:hypothetical protein